MMSTITKQAGEALIHINRALECLTACDASCSASCEIIYHFRLGQDMPMREICQAHDWCVEALLSASGYMHQTLMLAKTTQDELEESRND